MINISSRSIFAAEHNMLALRLLQDAQAAVERVADLPWPQLPRRLGVISVVCLTASSGARGEERSRLLPVGRCSAGHLPIYHIVRQQRHISASCSRALLSTFCRGVAVSSCRPRRPEVEVRPRLGPHSNCFRTGARPQAGRSLTHLSNVGAFGALTEETTQSCGLLVNEEITAETKKKHSRTDKVKRRIANYTGWLEVNW